jgi:peptidoglycan/LPS O-acetylase OafA/YrhL
MQTPTFEALAQARRERLPSITGLRFVAAFMVLCCQLGIVLTPRVAPEAAGWGLFHALGAVGVSFFFILSGFILTWVSKPDDTARLFWRRRFFKIYPNHLVTMVATLLLMLYAGLAITATNTLPTLFLVQSWIPSQEAILAYGPNTVTWSLACEVLFYAAFPGLLLLIQRINPARLWAWVGAVTAAVFAVPFVARLLPTEPLVVGGDIPWYQYWFVYFFPGTRLLEFVLGILMARIVLTKRWIGLPLWVGLLLSVAAFTVNASLPEQYGAVAPTVLPLALLIAGAATADARDRWTPFASRTMVFLGTISYAFYMVHWLVVIYGPIGAAYPDGWAKQSTLGQAALDAGLTLVITLFLAWLLYSFVERPVMRRWSRPASARRRAADARISDPGTADARTADEQTTDVVTATN